MAVTVSTNWLLRRNAKPRGGQVSTSPPYAGITVPWQYIVEDPDGTQAAYKYVNSTLVAPNDSNGNAYPVFVPPWIVNLAHWYEYQGIIAGPTPPAAPTAGGGFGPYPFQGPRTATPAAIPGNLSSAAQSSMADAATRTADLWAAVPMPARR